jgi:hypothetical protein
MLSMFSTALPEHLCVVSPFIPPPLLLVLADYDVITSALTLSIARENLVAVAVPQGQVVAFAGWCRFFFFYYCCCWLQLQILLPRRADV